MKNSRVADEQIIEVYFSRSAAEAANERLSTPPGFSDHADGFSVDAYSLKQDHWQEGFATVVPAMSVLWMVKCS